MPYVEIPSDDQVVEALVALGRASTAIKLCDKLVNDGHPRRDSQLAIQRTVERGRITVDPDWTLRVVEQAVAAVP